MTYRQWPQGENAVVVERVEDLQDALETGQTVIIDNFSEFLREALKSDIRRLSE